MILTSRKKPQNIHFMVLNINLFCICESLICKCFLFLFFVHQLIDLSTDYFCSCAWYHFKYFYANANMIPESR